MFWGSGDGIHNMASTTKSSASHQNRRQGVIREVLGPSDRDWKPCRTFGKTFQNTARGTFENQSYTRTLGRCFTAELLHAEGPRKGYANAIEEGGSVRFNQNKTAKQCTSTSSARWTGIPKHKAMTKFCPWVARACVFAGRTRVAQLFDTVMLKCRKTNLRNSLGLHTSTRRSLLAILAPLAIPCSMDCGATARSVLFFCSLPVFVACSSLKQTVVPFPSGPCCRSQVRDVPDDGTGRSDEEQILLVVD